MKDLSPPDHLSQSIKSNAEEFLNSGLALLFGRGAGSQDAKMAVLAIQTATELFAKYRLVQAIGPASIVEGKPPRRSVATALLRGKLRTIGYQKCLNLADERHLLTSGEIAAMKSLQGLRNALTHLGTDVDVEEVRDSAAVLLVRVLAMFAAGAERDEGEFQTHLRFLESQNLRALMNHATYRDEAVDAAHADYDTEDVYTCWECRAEAMAQRTSDALFCYCCGLTVEGRVVERCDCSLCGTTDGIFYDPLNESFGCHRGRCLGCEQFVWVKHCGECGQITAYRDGPEEMRECVKCSG